MLSEKQNKNDPKSEHSQSQTWRDASTFLHDSSIQTQKAEYYTKEDTSASAVSTREDLRSLVNLN